MLQKVSAGGYDMTDASSNMIRTLFGNQDVANDYHVAPFSSRVGNWVLWASLAP